MDHTRRSVLKTGVGAVAAAGIAGCLGGASDGDSGYDGYAAFFAPHDWAEQIGGERMSFGNPVSVGQMGHGWSPDGDVTSEIASTEVFFYLDTPEFSWAQTVAGELQQDYTDVHAVDLLDGLGPHLIGFDSEALPEPDHGHEYPPERLVLSEFDIFDLRSDDQLGYWHTDHWHGGVPDVPVDGFVPVGIVLSDDEERVVPLGEAESYQVDARIADGAPTEVLEIESLGDRVEFRGQTAGSTAVVFEIVHDGAVIYDTADEPAPVDIVENPDAEGADAFHDPHTWVDPVLAQEMVESIASTLSDLDPENADIYAESAAEYTERMESVHREFEELAENADRDVAVFVGHSSFAYVERRYGFELVTPVGISPDAAESFEDISTLIEVIDAHDIDTVLYDPFETADPGEDRPQMVEVIFENTAVTDAEPLTPVEGTTREWVERDWGWIEQMEQINLPSLRAALDA
ncbi:MAG: zinc ABC transporter substrate-binding protein [Natronomonas sp.]